ncbi:type II toxin-antitoxin system HipA family toxin [Nocardia sp. NPDC058666]|uniref:type II toxin-antitoxin system HipA family toxin n=1 Tax=Nocardia sp. NPDC058666 TaxID=3346587 RepID=UPI00364F2D2C
MASTSDEAFVWMWPAGSTDPIPAGRLRRGGDGGLWFQYGRRYAARPDAVSLSPTLPLGSGSFGPTEDLGMPGALRDGAPDAWGRRVLLNALTGAHGLDADVTALDELTYLLRSGSNRFGAIDFQQSPLNYVPRADTASLDELHRAARIVEAGDHLPTGLAEAIIDGTTMGGARPKALVRDESREYLAKFSTSSDPFPVVTAEAASLTLARRAGIRVPDTRVVTSLGRNVLLIERFDRPGDGRRTMVVSALTLTDLGEMTARYGSYPWLLRSLREHGTDAGAELFTRIAFNIAISNTDDHLRNHAAFWDGSTLTLTPAYDLSPIPRSGETAYQAIAYGPDGERESNLAALIAVAHVYGLDQLRARDVVDRMVEEIRTGWDEAADEARLTQAERSLLWGRQFLNPGALRGMS